MAKTGRDVRCKRCKKTVGDSLNLKGWGADVRDGDVVGYICPGCMQSVEAKQLPEGATLDIGHGYEETAPITDGNFRFLKKLVDTPDYYGNSRHDARMDWETFGDIIRRCFEQIGHLGIQFDMTNQILWNFRLGVERLPNGELKIHSTGYHTQGGKKGKQVDPNLIENLKAMGMKQPEGDERNWTIILTAAESMEYNLNKVIIHILERGYEFNPNLIQDMSFAEFGDNS
jgi:hypothetical protein